MEKGGAMSRSKSRGILLAIAGLALSAPMSAAAQSAFTTDARYDANRQLVGTISADPDGSGSLPRIAVRNTYDAGGRLTKKETGTLAQWQSPQVEPRFWANFVVQTIVDITYDNQGRKTSEALSSSAGAIYQFTQYSYDATGRLECTAVRMNPTFFGSLATGACTPTSPAGTNGPDRITKNLYDAAGNLTQIRKAVGTGIEQAYVTYTYTANGKQRFVIDANGNKAQNTYDGFDRLAGWYFPSVTPPTAFNSASVSSVLSTAGAVSSTDFEAYGYDANDNKTTFRKRDGRSFSYTYDALDRMTSKIVPDACVSGYACTNVPASMTRDVYYSYDLGGLQTAARFDGPSGADAVTTNFDGFGRLSSTSTSMGGVSRTFSYQYDADGNRTRITHPDGVYFDYAYDGLDRPVSITENGGATVVAMAWDAQGRRASEARGGVTSTYAYDQISRLESINDDLAGASYDLTTTFQHNSVGQIVARTRTNALYSFGYYTNTSRSYGVNGLNQYSTVGGNAHGYDSNGNLVWDGGVSYTYDAENRLVVTSAGATLTYDALGRLYETYSGSTGATRFSYDGDQLTAEYSSAGVLLRRYVHGTGEDDPLLWYEGAGLSVRRSLQADHQGSVVSIADASGTAYQVNTYDEYGVPGSNLGRFQYTGQAWIPELGMYHYKARVYSPMLGRFLQVDPVGYDDQVNLYAYIGSDPLNGRDPDGTCETPTGSHICYNQVEALDRRWGLFPPPAQTAQQVLGQTANCVSCHIIGGIPAPVSPMARPDASARSRPTATTTTNTRRADPYSVTVQIQGPSMKNYQNGMLSMTVSGKKPITLSQVEGAIMNLSARLSRWERGYYQGAVLNAMKWAGDVSLAGGISQQGYSKSHFASRKPDRVDIVNNVGHNIIMDPIR
jgi:RHS repeat-associated protein